MFIISSKTMFGQDYNWIIIRLTIFAICSIKIKPDTSKRAFLNTVRISVYSANYTYKKKLVMLRSRTIGWEKLTQQKFFLLLCDVLNESSDHLNTTKQKII